MSHDKMVELAESKRQHDAEVLRANRLKLPPGTEESLRLLESTAPPPPPQVAATTDAADAACQARDFANAIALYTRAATAVGTGKGVPLADVLSRKAHCHRRALDAEAAVDAAAAALTVAPYHNPALFEQGLGLLDAGRPVQAIESFATLAAVNASWPNTLRWLVHAHARARHRGIGPVDGPVEEGFVYGARVRTIADYVGLWGAGDLATIVGLGSVTAPIIILFDRTQKTINTQREHLEILPTTMGIAGGHGGAGSSSEGPPDSHDHFSVLGNLPADFTPAELKRGSVLPSIAFPSRVSVNGPEIVVYYWLSECDHILLDGVRGSRSFAVVAGTKRPR